VLRGQCDGSLLSYSRITRPAFILYKLANFHLVIAAVVLLVVVVVVVVLVVVVVVVVVMVELVFMYGII
jgi:hypothetical protein